MQIPALGTAPASTDKIGRALIWAGGILSALGAELVKARNEQLADELDQARTALAELADLAAAAAAELDEHEREEDEHQGAEHDEHQGAELVEKKLEDSSINLNGYSSAAPRPVDYDRDPEIQDWLGFGGGDLRDRL